LQFLWEVGYDIHTNQQSTFPMTQLWTSYINQVTTGYGKFFPSSPMLWLPIALCTIHTLEPPLRFPPQPTTLHLHPHAQPKWSTFKAPAHSPQPIPPPPATTLSAHLLHLWKDRSWPLHSSVFPDNGQTAAQAIHFGMAHVVCDGLYMSEASPDFATASWLLEDSLLPQHNLCQGIIHVSGPPSEANAYHANCKDSVLSFWQSKDFAHSIEFPLDLLLWDVTIRGLFIKPNRSRNSLPAAQFMLTISVPFVESTTQSQV